MTLQKFIFLLFLVPSLASALESTLSDEESCNQWKTSVTGWFQQHNVKLVGENKEVRLSCNKDQKDRNWTGRIAYRLTPERAQQISSISQNLDCATPGSSSVQRGVASVTSSLLDTPCKIAGNDIKLFREQIISEKKIAVSDGGYVCCGGKIANRWTSCMAGAMFDTSCKLSCAPCIGISTGPGWGF